MENDMEKTKVMRISREHLSAETWIFKIIELTQLGSSEMWCWKRMKKIIWANQVENEKVLHRVKMRRTIIQSYIHKTKEG
jgi:hypothetical protein